jgi:predicted dehydrogenase
MHVEWSLKAMQAGKHVLCEKPMAMQASDFDPLIAARDAAGVLAAEAFMIVHHPQWQRARQLLAEGAIGRLWRIDGVFSFNNRDAANIRNRADMGGGGLRDIGVYVMGGARFVTGLEASEMQARIQWESGVDVYAAITARFGEADYAAFTSIRMHPRQEMIFHGDEGVLRLPAPFSPRVFGEARLELRRGAETSIERWPGASHYELQAAAFNRGVRDGAAYPCPLEFSRGTQLMMDAAFANSV